MPVTRTGVAEWFGGLSDSQFIVYSSRAADLINEYLLAMINVFFFFQAEDGIRDGTVTGVQTCALPISDGEALLGRGILAQARGREHARGDAVRVPRDQAHEVKRAPARYS